MAGHLSNVIVYTGGYAFLVFIAVCLATGLYYLAEMVEAGPPPTPAPAPVPCFSQLPAVIVTAVGSL